MTSSMEGDSQESKVAGDAEEMRISEGDADAATSILMLSVDGRRGATNARGQASKPVPRKAQG